MSKLKPFLLILAAAFLLLACNIDSYVRTPTPYPTLAITLPPPTLTPIPTVRGEQ